MPQYLFRTLSLLVFIFTAFAAQAQTTVTIMGKVTDRESNKVLSEANLTIEGTSKGTSTDKNGEYTLRYVHRKPIKLVVSYLGYEEWDMIIDGEVLKQAKNDTLRLDIKLESAAVLLNTFSLSGDIDTVFGSEQLSVEDFEFHEEYYVILVYEKTLKKGSKLVLADRKQQIISSYTIPKEAIELFKDFTGTINVVCKGAVYRVEVLEDELLLYPRDMAEFNYLIRPVIDTLGAGLYFTDYHPDFPAANYFYDDEELDTAKLVHAVKDEFMMELFRSEYKYLEPRGKIAARDLADQYNIDKEVAAAILSGFANSLYYKPVYAPMFVVNDTVLVFDHYKSLIFRYDDEHDLIDSVGITYHTDQKTLKWEEQLITDEYNDKVYAVFSRNGYTYLKMLDPNTGEVVKTFKFTFKYAGRIHIKNDFVYYVYRPHGSLQKKFLYRELIK